MMKIWMQNLLIEDQKDRLDWNDYFNHKFFEETKNYKNLYIIGDKIGNSKYAQIFKAIEKKVKKKGL